MSVCLYAHMYMHVCVVILNQLCTFLLRVLQSNSGGMGQQCSRPWEEQSERERLSAGDYAPWVHLPASCTCRRLRANVSVCSSASSLPSSLVLLFPPLLPHLLNWYCSVVAHCCQNSARAGPQDLCLGAACLLFWPLLSISDLSLLRLVRRGFLVFVCYADRYVGQGGMGQGERRVQLISSVSLEN